MDNYLILWPNDWCKSLEKADDKGPIEVIFGGEHQSVPPLGKVTVGDTVYPVRVNGGILYLLGSFEITAIDDVERYLSKIKLDRPKGMLWDTASGTVLKEKPELGHRIPRNCVNLAATGKGTPLRFNNPVPLSIVEKLELGPNGKEKPLPLKDGKVSHVNLQGHFRRLDKKSATLLESLLK